jgi:2-methylcitrate dehydratase PrpD
MTCGTRPGFPSAELDLAQFALGMNNREIAAMHPRARAWLLDYLGVTVAGAALIAPELAVLARTFGADIGELADAPAPARAQVFGYCAHAMDFDDTSVASSIHPGAVIWSALLAVNHSSTTEELLDAAVAGYEVACRVGDALGQGPFRRGFHPTALAGAVGAVAAVARLRRESVDVVTDAWGLLLSMNSGSLQGLSRGSANKRLNAGWAALAAVAANDYASAGIVGAADAITGEFGLLRAYGSVESDSSLADDLGSRWSCETVALKPVPACWLTYGSAEAADNIRTSAGDATRWDSVEVSLSPHAFEIVGRRDSDGLEVENYRQAQFSVCFQVATHLTTNGRSWSIYDNLHSTTALMRSIVWTVRPDPSLEDAAAAVTARSSHGTTHSWQADGSTLQRALYGAGTGWERSKFVANCRYAGIDDTTVETLVGHATESDRQDAGVFLCFLSTAISRVQGDPRGDWP